MPTNYNRLREACLRTAEKRKPSDSADELFRAVNAFPFRSAAGVPLPDTPGLDALRRKIRDEIVGPALRAENPAATGNLLLYGPPGNGVNPLILSIAADLGANICHVEPQHILSKYYGESPRRIRILFESARRAGNAVIVLSNFEILGNTRGRTSGFMSQISGALQQEMDRIDDNRGRLTVIATSEFPWNVDETFFQPHRLARCVYVPLPDRDVRLHFIRSRLESVPHHDDVDFSLMADRTEGLGLFRISAICDSAVEGPIRRGKESGDINQFVAQEDVLKALRSVRRFGDPEYARALAQWQPGKDASFSLK